MSRRVVVTGGAKGIGLAVVERFTALGDDVTGLSHADLDVTDEQAVERTFADIGEVDVLVNNAGIAESAPLTKTTLEQWRRHFDVNVTGPFLCTRAVVGGMRARGSGCIVTVASTAGRIGTPYTSAYTASKHAAVGLMCAVAGARRIGRSSQRRLPDVRAHRAHRAVDREHRGADRAHRRSGRARAHRADAARAAARTG